MFGRPRFRTSAILVVLLALAAPLCEAASQRVPGHARPSSASPHLPSVWRWIASLWAKNGCGLDPGGVCTTSTNPTSHPVAPGTSGSSADAGCGIDPSGKPCGGHS
jgi:hypothetical protein